VPWIHQGTTYLCFRSQPTTTSPRGRGETCYEEEPGPGGWGHAIRKCNIAAHAKAKNYFQTIFNCQVGKNKKFNVVKGLDTISGIRSHELVEKLQLDIY
jgi:hypothetical protein